MMDWYFLLTPIAVLTVLLLFRFVGCNALLSLDETDFSGAEDHQKSVKGDDPLIYLRLQESPGAAVAKNEMGQPEGAYGLWPSPLHAGDPNWKSTEVGVTVLQLGVTDEPILLANDPNSTSIRVVGGYVWVEAGVPPLNSLTEFTVEALVLPEWNLQDRGKYYCVMELAGVVSQTQVKNGGFGIYAGPDSDANSPYHWQFWVGNGQFNGFQRLNPVQPYNDPADPGPTVAPQPTYLAVTFSQSQARAVLYMYYVGRGASHTTYEFALPPYVPAHDRLYVGIAGKGPLFPPAGFTVLYPLWGRIAEVAIYDKVLSTEQVLIHGMSAFSTY